MTPTALNPTTPGPTTSTTNTTASAGSATRAERRAVVSARSVRSLARPSVSSWEATRQDRITVWTRLTGPPLGPLVNGGSHRRSYEHGLGLLLDWLEVQAGATWQDRWMASGADAERAWREIPDAWLHDNQQHRRWQRAAFYRALVVALGADVLRPSLPWLVSVGFRKGSLVNILSRCRDGADFARLRELCSTNSAIAPDAATRTAYRAALILAAKGGTIAEIVPGDVLELLDAEAEAHGSIPGTHLFYRVLHAMGGLGDDAPATLRELRTRGRLTVEEMIDRYQLRCRPIRDLIVDYLRERQPALDYTSLLTLANYLGNRFWADLERHHPGIDSLHLPAAVADAWKQRLRTMPATITVDGRPVHTHVPRLNFRECLTPVRAFYLDLAHWAVEDPARWGPWVAPCPIGTEEINRRKDLRQRKSRMDTRTRERLPVLPVLVRTVDQRRRDAADLLAAARHTEPNRPFTAAGQTLLRIAPKRALPGRVWALEPGTGVRRDLIHEEEHAFWVFAAIEVLRATGIRIEELTELSHHSLVQYRLPSTGEIVPLLQITPSKTDTERLLLVNPELADVLAAILHRIRNPDGSVPLVAAYDTHECTWSPPIPLLFQRRYSHEDRAITTQAIRKMLTAALAHTGLTDPTTGGPLHFTPHDFRRLFITDAITSGLPPHIAQVIAGHRDINVTLGYKAVYPEEAIQAHRAFLARRRATRPSEEYRTPTEEEWDAFLAHFEKRKVSIGTCARAFGTPCIHEHACVRCSLLRPDPSQRARLAEIRDNLIARIAEAEREGRLGEVEGLQVSLAGAEEKLRQLDSGHGQHTAADLGIPTTRGNR